MSIVRLDEELILLTALNKNSTATGGHYDGGLLAPARVRW